MTKKICLFEPVKDKEVIDYITNFMETEKRSFNMAVKVIIMRYMHLASKGQIKLDLDSQKKIQSRSRPEKPNVHLTDSNTDSYSTNNYTEDNEPSLIKNVQEENLVQESEDIQEETETVELTFSKEQLNNLIYG